MRFFFLLITALVLMPALTYAKDFTVKSPDNRIALTVTAADKISWSISFNEKPVIAPSELSMTLETTTLPGTKSKVVKSTVKEIDEELKPVIPHKNSIIRDHYKELNLRFNDNFSVVFRVYNDGVAYRFLTNFKEEITVKGESFSLVLPQGSTAWYPLEESFMSHNECTFYPATMDTIGPGHLASLPVLFKSEGINVLLTEADIHDYPGMWIHGDGHGNITSLFPQYPEQEQLVRDRDLKVISTSDYISKTNGTRSFPWRVCIITPEDGDLVESDMVYKLAAPSEISDTQWIRPGKVAWDWWNANNLYGVDFEAGLNNKTYKHYIDFASENHIEYVILDEGWYNLGDVLSVADGFDIKELCDYASQKNVGIILWVVWKSFYDKMDEALDQFERWGVRGIKVDFMQRDDQKMVNFYHETAAKAAEHHMIVDFHGSYKPDGMERTWPNVITREGVKGLEHNKWSRECNPEHDLILPFTRMVAGPMDYTPGAMRNMQRRDFTPSFYRPSSQGTRVHQMAMYVVYESPLMMLADSPSNYEREKDCVRFISLLPVTWEETRVLSAKAGDYIVIARRNGITWYIAAMTDWTPRTIEVDLSFLQTDGDYYISYYCDGINAKRFAEDYETNNRSISPDRKLTITMAPGGGFVGKIYSGEIAGL